MRPLVEVIGMSGKRFVPVVRSVLGLVLVGLLTLGTPRQASAASIIYVNAAAGGTNNGTSWKDAYTDLQAAITYFKGSFSRDSVL